MTQPSFVPILEADQVRPARRLQVPGPWMSDRPADLHSPVRPSGTGLGTPGPDQGFALRLARRFEDRLRLSPGELIEDAILGSALLASRRAGLFGRAPSIHDVTVAVTLWRFLTDAPAELVVIRRSLFGSVSHEYFAQRRLVDSVPEEILKLAPGAVTGNEWQFFLGASQHHDAG